MHERGFTGTGWSHDRGELPGCEGDGDIVERGNFRVGAAIGFRQVLSCDGVSRHGGCGVYRHASILRDPRGGNIGVRHDLVWARLIFAEEFHLRRQVEVHCVR